MGIPTGAKVLMFVRPKVDFSAITFALFKAGFVPIFIDPGMGRQNLLAAIKQIKPDALIAEQEVHLAGLIFRSAFKTIRWKITLGGLAWGEMQKVSNWRDEVKEVPTVLENVNAEDHAAILFTSGGTGIPKGVLYTHRIFNRQTEMLQKIFDLQPGQVDIPGFPLFSLFTIAMGMTSAIPFMDPSKPAKADPRALVENINDHQATFVAGSPAIWERVADYCVKKNIKLPSVKHLVMFGAPVRFELHQKFQQILSNGQTFTPYGATECLPVSNISGADVLENGLEKMTQGKGTCIGRPVPGVEVKIIGITEEAIDNASDAEFITTPFQIGEIAVYGETVTPMYVDMPQKTAEAKMRDERGGLWHRMGDIGYFDGEGQLWFCGRKSHRVESAGELLSSVQCEAIYNQHPAIKRSALIAYGNGSEIKPAIVIEHKDGRLLNQQEKAHLFKELKEMGASFPHTQKIETFFQKKSFPVDVRHNIKIDRLRLSREANEGRLS
jgi:acyl-CoA synthetase (AMP-forming)/AMP-acid ligase II